MSIAELLKEAQYSRITIGDRWLIWNGRWVVLEKLRYRRRTTVIIETGSEDEAVLELLKGEDELYSDVIEKAKKKLQ